jgi:hypothetical protein
MKYIIILSLFLTSCGASFHLKQSEKHLQKAIDLGAQIKVDTIYKEIVIKSPPIKVEFEPKIFTAHDTVYYEQKIPNSKQPVKIRIIYLKDSTGNQTAQPSLEFPETFHKGDIPVEVKKEITVPPKLNKWRFIMIGMFSGILITLIIMGFITRSRK